MKATPGRTVLYVLKDGAIRPATVIECLDGDRCCLQVFMKPLEKLHESDYQALVPHSALAEPGTWHWPHFASHHPATVAPEAPVSTGEQLMGVTVR
jgi:hypothetical protein